MHIRLFGQPFPIAELHTERLGNLVGVCTAAPTRLYGHGVDPASAMGCPS